MKNSVKMAIGVCIFCNLLTFKLNVYLKRSIKKETVDHIDAMTSGKT